MKFKQALLKILDYLEKEVTIEASLCEALRNDITEAPADLDFSVLKSKMAFQKLPHARIPNPHLELEGWLEEVAHELYQVGIKMHADCKCGGSQDEHVIVVFTIFYLVYLEEEISTILMRSNKKYTERLRQCVNTYYLHRPSNN